MGLTMDSPRKWVAWSQAKKHVVFLGAGASVTSGYPLANELTLLMSNPDTFKERLRDLMTAEGDFESVERGFHTDSIITRHLALSEAAKLLRSGDFATMDELSKDAVMGGRHADKVYDLKKLMRLVLSFHNPDVSNYGASDYRALIQKLFHAGPLRQDTSIISFNYDPYLEFRLFRAYETRAQVRPVSDEPPDYYPQAISSGFFKPEDVSWLGQPGLCHLKLHGVCALPAMRHPGRLTLPVQPKEPQEFHSGYLFARGFRTAIRVACLCQPPFSDQAPPALLPWEIVHETGKRLLSETEFSTAVGDDWEHRALYPLFAGIWERARREVQSADKISFVGLSLGPYLEPGLRYLFGGKTGDLQLVVANMDNKRFKEQGNQQHPSSPAGRALELLAEKCGIRCRIFGSFSEFDGNMAVADFHLENHQPTVTCHNSFREMIQAEM